MKDSHYFFKKIKEGVKQIKKLDGWDISSGLQAIFEAFDSISELQSDCLSIKDDLIYLESWATIFVTPMTLMADIKINLKDYAPQLEIEALQAKEQLSDQKFFKFGKSVGKMVAILT